MNSCLSLIWKNINHFYILGTVFILWFKLLVFQSRIKNNPLASSDSERFNLIEDYKELCFKREEGIALGIIILLNNILLGTRSRNSTIIPMSSRPNKHIHTRQAAIEDKDGHNVINFYALPFLKQTFTNITPFYFLSFWTISWKSSKK